MKRCAMVLVWCLLFGHFSSAQQTSNPLEAAEQFLKSGVAALEQNQIEKAESDLRRSAAIALDQLGGLNTSLGRYERAESAYEQASRLSPSTIIRSLMGLGIVYFRTGRYDEGIRAVERIFPLDLNNAEARHLLGKLYFIKGDFERAVQELGRAYGNENGDPRVGYTLALAQLRLKRLDEAQSLFKDLENRLGATPQLHLLLGRGLRETGYPHEAVAEFKKAIALDPRYPGVHHQLGYTYLTIEGGNAYPQARDELELELQIKPDQYNSMFLLGVILTLTREYEKAVNLLERAIKMRGDDPDPYLYLGQAYFHRGDHMKAIPALQKCIELTTDVSRNGYQLANCHFLLGQALRKAGDREKAAVHFQQAEELKARKTNQQRSEQAPETEEESGRRNARALAKAQEPELLLDVEPLDPETKKMFENWVQLYSRAAALGLQNLARLETTRSSWDKAADFLRSAAIWDESLPDLHFNLGLAQIKAGHPDKAAEALLEAHKRRPRKEIPQLLANLSIQLVDGYFSDEALRVTEFLLKSNPNVSDLYLLRGRAFAQRGKWDDALRELESAHSKAPSLPETNYFMGTVYIRQGELEKAREAFDRELKLNPKHPQAMYHKAFVLVSQRKMEEAIPLLEEVVRLEPRYPEPYYQLGKALLEKNEMLLALANLETAARLNPEAPYIQYQLSRAYTKSRRKEDAQKALDRYRELKKLQEQARAARQTQPALEEGEN